MIVKQIIRMTNDWIMDGTMEDIHEDFNSVSLPVWDELTYEERLASLASIYEDCETRAEDFTHSECCTPIEQATCAFCIQFFKQQDLLEILMEDLDFMMVDFYAVYGE